VQTDLAKPGQVLQLDIRGKSVPATVMKLPFYQRSSFQDGSQLK